MNAPVAQNELARQHLIDPEICIRCNTCEETCPTGAIKHDRRNYAVVHELWTGRALFSNYWPKIKSFEDKNKDGVIEPR